MSRPNSKLTDEVIDLVMSEIADGKPLRQIARENGFSKSLWYELLASDDEVAGRFARARSEGFDAIAESILEIVDDKADDPASRRVRYDARLKLLAKWDPKRYGEKLEHTGADGGPIKHAHSHEIDISSAPVEVLKYLAGQNVDDDQH